MVTSLRPILYIVERPSWPLGNCGDIVFSLTGGRPPDASVDVIVVCLLLTYVIVFIADNIDQLAGYCDDVFEGITAIACIVVFP